MKVALLGFDRDGKASYDYYRKQGAEITICDQKTDIEVPAGAGAQLGKHYLDDLDRFDVIVRTSGMPPHVILDPNPGVAGKITTVINEFMRVCPTRNIIGITGTKGKGTTSTLLTAMLRATGREVQLGGNIGLPPLTFLDELTADSWVVLELSSFQLMDMRYSPHIGVCLMIVPEHLNWHADMDEYTGAKAHLFEQQTSDDIAIYFGDNKLSKQIASAGAGRKLPYYRSPGAWINGNMVTIGGAEICTTDDIKLLGQHNRQNICAALTAYWQVDQNIDAARSAISTFTGLPHRLEKVREHAGLTYYNDSFASAPDAAMAAMAAVPGKKVLILGGFDRMLPIDHLAKALQENNDVQQALLIGASAERLAAACKDAGFTRFTVSKAKTMSEIVAEARQLAKKGDAIILSPGFPSFDMFKDFEERGLQFKSVVSGL